MSLSRPVVVVAMSGGVDSSVTALLLKQQGYEVIGMFMKNWEEQDDTVCTATDDLHDVARVCDQIGIPYYAVNFVKEYQEHVFSYFLKELEAGGTPNPDILCNREIKFKFLLEKAKSLGAEFLATGHYCRVMQENGQTKLYKGIDPGKDQSYFLYAVHNEALRQVLFPVGAMHKSEIRALAKQHQLATAEKKDSTGICFIGERRFKQFLSQHLVGKKGFFEDLNGKVLGEHAGIAYYTIGQRKGLGIGGPGDAWFVVKKDKTRNVVTLAQGIHHPALFCDSLTATELSWIASSDIPLTPFICKSKIRYRQPDQECIIEKIENGIATVQFPIPQRAVTPRQSIVFYQEDKCLGGGVIESAGPSYYESGKMVPSTVIIAS